MERLTHERLNGIRDGYWSPNKKQELVDRLAAYENTNLDPEQVKHVKETAKKYLLEKAQGKVGGWIPVEERLPDESLNSVIGWDEYRERCCFVQYYGGRWMLRADREPIKITHWRPIPDRPADKTEAPDWRESLLRKFDRRD